MSTEEFRLLLSEGQMASIMDEFMAKDDEIDTLREALAPFAAAWNDDEDGLDQYQPTCKVYRSPGWSDPGLTVADFQAAAAALAGEV